MNLPNGVYTALITPMKEDGSIDFEAFDSLIDDQIEAKVAGLVVLGSTGEVFTLTDDEKSALIKATVKKAKGIVPIIVGTGCISTHETIKRSLEAEKLGADALLIITPPYIKPTQEGLYEHYKAVASSCRTPILLYNNPGRAAVELNIDTIKRLSEIKNIIGIKDSPKIISHPIGIIEEVLAARKDFKLFCGDCNMTYPLIALGAHGVVSGSANLIPHEMVKLTNYALQGDFEKAKELHYKLQPLFHALSLESNPIPLKALMELHGKRAGKPRSPLTPLSKVLEYNFELLALTALN